MRLSTFGTEVERVALTNLDGIRHALGSALSTAQAAPAGHSLQVLPTELVMLIQQINLHSTYLRFP